MNLYLYTMSLKKMKSKRDSGMTPVTVWKSLGDIDVVLWLTKLWILGKCPMNGGLAFSTLQIRIKGDIQRGISKCAQTIM